MTAPNSRIAWIIEPRDPLIARDGRPFSADPGARATSMAFPMPSTTAGGLRTRAGQDSFGRFTASPEEVLPLRAHGPLLVELDNVGQVCDWLFAAPADALLLKIENDAKQARRKRLVPQHLVDGALLQLPESLPFLPGMEVAETEDAKPLAGPLFWNWTTFEKWLISPEPEATVTLNELGHDGPTRETRIHVKLDDATLAAEEGQLFGTSGLEFSRSQTHNQRITRNHRLALLMLGDEGLSNHPIPDGAGRLGGERRLVGWTRSQSVVPSCPCRSQIVSDKACRLFLLTPAHFAEAWKPAWAGRTWGAIDVHVKLQSACVGRAVTISGWDMAFIDPSTGRRGRAKPTRRLVPAGSVYFLKLSGSAEAIANWVNSVWLNPVSDDPQDKRDGFGLAALGVWDGQIKPSQGG